MLKHALFDGRLHIYKRDDSKYWQASTYLDRRNHRTSTKEEVLTRAKEFAEDWYLDLRGKHRAGHLKHGKRFKEAAKQFLREYEVITQGQRHPRWVTRLETILDRHLLPFFGERLLAEINAGLVQEYRIHRHENPVPRPGQDPEKATPPSFSTMHHEIVTLRQVLKTAERHEWLRSVPDLSPPFKQSDKVKPRPWFSPEEYKQLYKATRRRAQNPKRKRYKWSCEQLHDYVLFMANTGLRPDESARLEYRDVQVVEEESTDETILHIEVRGKRGFGYCKSMPGAVTPFRRLLERNKPQPTDRLFPLHHRELFNNILEEEGLKYDRDGNRRTPYSLRHTYICMRLMEGADIYQIAKNCRTSVEMIEKFYASHIKNMLDAAAINVRRPRTAKAKGAKKAKEPKRWPSRRTDRSEDEPRPARKTKTLGTRRAQAVRSS